MTARPRNRILLRVLASIGGSLLLFPCLALAQPKSSSTEPQQKQTPASVVYKAFHNSVLQIETDKKTGTGFLVLNDQLVATSYHVVDDATRITVRDSGNESWAVRALAYDKEADLAILSLADKTHRANIPLAAKGAVSPGDNVIVISNQLGFLSNSLTTGVVSALRLDEGVPILQFTAAISKGSSGAPVLTEKGEVAGVVRSTFVAGQNLNVAVSASSIHLLLGSKYVTSLEFFAQNQKRESNLAEAKRAEDERLRLDAEIKIKEQLDRNRQQQEDLKKARKEKRDALASQFLALKNEIESLIKESNEDGKIHDIKSRTCDRIRSNIESRLIDLRREVDTLQELKYRLAQLEQERGGNVNTQLARASAVLLQQRLVRDQQRKVDEIVDECKAMKQGYDETLADARVLESKMDRRSKEISMKLEQLKLLAGELDKMDAIDPPAAMSLQDQRFP